MGLFSDELEVGRECYNHSRREQSMWRAVITQALMDASSQSSKPEARYEKSQALCWLTGYSEDFKTVCDHAGLSPAYVRRSAIIAIKRGCKWRMDSSSPQPQKI